MAATLGLPQINTLKTQNQPYHQGSPSLKTETQALGKQAPELFSRSDENPKLSELNLDRLNFVPKIYNDVKIRENLKMLLPSDFSLVHLHHQ